MHALSVLHVTAGLHPAFGGPSRTVTHLTDALAAAPGMSVSLLALGRAGDPVVPSENPAVSRRVLESASAQALKWAWPLRRTLMGLGRQPLPDLIHGHGLWLPANHWTACAARRWKLPLILHPRGMLEPWAVEHKGWKKRLAMACYQRRDLDTVKVLVATAEAEYVNLRQLGLKQPIAVIPNGVHVPMALELNCRSPRKVGTPRTVLFLSRIQGKKGLLNLIQAWARLRPVGWQLKIAGPDEAGHLAEVLTLARQLGVADAVDYAGEVDGPDKTALYREADLFVLPTFSENFGVVVAEALAHCLPVITTKGAPWADLVTQGCGWWIEIGVEPLVAALQNALALSDASRNAMGARGRTYVRRFDWPDIAAQHAAVYRWVLEQGDRPECVLMA